MQYGLNSDVKICQAFSPTLRQVAGEGSLHRGKFRHTSLKECLQQPTDDERRHMAYGMGMGMVGGVSGESGQFRSYQVTENI